MSDIKKQSCSACKYFGGLADKRARLSAYIDCGPIQAFCRRFPPVRVDYRENDQDGEDCTEEWQQWDQPVVLSDGWCGEFSA